MAKLKIKDRKNLPDKMFGLPEDKKYPMPDETHVRSAIRFFNDCPENKKKELAKNINRRAKELNMKILTKGPFMRYISPDIKAKPTDEGVSIVQDASNIGTLSPIVGGIDQSTTLKFDPTSGRNEEDDELMLDVLKGKYDLGFNSDPEDDNSHVDEFYYPKLNIMHTVAFRKATLIEGKPIRPSYNEIDNWQLDKAVEEIIAKNEYENARKYTSDSHVDTFKHEYLMKQVMVPEKLRELLLGYADDHKEEVAKKIAYMLCVLTVNSQRYVLSVVGRYNLELLRAVTDEIAELKHQPMTKLTAMAFSEGPNINAWTCSPLAPYPETKGIPETIITEAIKNIEHYNYLLVGPVEDTISDMIDGVPECYDPCYYRDLIVLYNMMKSGKIDGYFCRKEVGSYEHIYLAYSRILCRIYNVYFYHKINNKPGLYAILLEIGKFPHNHVNTLDDRVIKNTSEFVMEALLEIAKDPRDKETLQKYIHMIDLTDPDDPKEVFASEGLNLKAKIHRAKEFIKGIHINDNGDIKFNLQDQLTFDHYNETHTVLKENAKSENYEAMKENLSYIFSIIATIESLYMIKGTKKKPDVDEKTYEDMIRLRALYMSDFKSYMRILMKHDHQFNFLEYYKSSNANNNVYVIKGEHIRKAAQLFRAIMLA